MDEWDSNFAECNPDDEYDMDGGFGGSQLDAEPPSDDEAAPSEPAPVVVPVAESSKPLSRPLFSDQEGLPRSSSGGAEKVSSAQDALNGSAEFSGGWRSKSKAGVAAKRRRDDPQAPPGSKLRVTSDVVVPGFAYATKVAHCAAVRGQARVVCQNLCACRCHTNESCF